MKNIKLRLTLDVVIDPQSLAPKECKGYITRMMNHCIANGLLTGDSDATVEHYKFKVVQRRRKAKQFYPLDNFKHCKKCGTPLNSRGRCTDKTCIYSDHPQSADLGVLYEPKENV